MEIEALMGRTRDCLIKWGERIIDIDIIYFDNQIIDFDACDDADVDADD